MTIETEDVVVKSLVAREIEKAWREGWSCGYSAGLREEPESGTYWCDEERDWRESESRALTKEAGIHGQMLWTRQAHCGFCGDTGVFQEGSQTPEGYVVTMTLPCPHCLLDEEKCCAGGPQWGHALDCPKRPT